MATQNYLTLYKDMCETLSKQESHENEVTYIISDIAATQIMMLVSHGRRYAFIPVNEPFKSGKKVTKRSIDLSKFKSLNQVQDLENVIRFKRLCLYRKNILDNFMNCLRNLNIASSEQNFSDTLKLFDLSVSMVDGNQIHITTYQNCKVIECVLDDKSNRKIETEEIFLTYEDVAKHSMLIKTSDESTFNLPKKERAVISADFVNVSINNEHLGLVQEIEIGDFFVRAGESVQL